MKKPILPTTFISTCLTCGHVSSVRRNRLLPPRHVRLCPACHVEREHQIVAKES